MPTAIPDGSPAELLVDGHVHVYPWMSVQRLLDAASSNLGICDGSATGGERGILLVADPEGIGGYERLAGNGDVDPRPEHDGWVRESHDPDSVSFRHASGKRLTALRGQQLITREGLELLGFGCSSLLQSGLPLSQLVERVRGAGGWSVIAWGVGKWLGRRGRIVTDMIVAEAGRPDIMLGDNGGRPWCWYRVAQFEAAAERGMRILPGTDPLPLKGEEQRVGSYGFRMHVSPRNDETLIGAFRQALEEPDVPLHTIGTRMSVTRFVSNQARLRLRSRLS